MRNDEHSLFLPQSVIDGFKKIGVGVELLTNARIRGVSHTEAKALGFVYNGDLEGYVIPFYDPLTDEHIAERLRRLNPGVDADGKALAKYLTKPKAKRFFYVPRGCQSLYSDPSIMIVFVEAEKSALALLAWAQRSGVPLLPIGCGGCWGWRGTVETLVSNDGTVTEQKGTLQDLHRVPLRGRKVIILFDANAATNPEVQVARRAFGRVFKLAGADVHIADVPVTDGVNGPDDYIGICGDEAMHRVLSECFPMQTKVLVEATTAVAILNQHSPWEDRLGAFDLIGEVGSEELRELLIVDAAKALKSGKKQIRDAVQNRLADLARDYKLERQTAERARLAFLPLDANLLIKIEHFLNSHAHLPKDSGLVLALWVINTWTFEIFKTTPYLLLQSAMPGCGKSTVLQLLNEICAKPRSATALTEATLFRIIELESPTLLVDEAELLAGRGERFEAIRAVANAGYKRGAKVPRCVGD